MSTDNDYFGLFGLPVQYRIDRARLEQAYERLTLEHHPDFFAAAPPAELAEAERKSALLNEAYRVLADDVLRAACLIERLAAGPYLEMFARGARPGWDVWGDQRGLFDDGRVATRRWPSDLARAPKTPVGQ